MESDQNQCPGTPHEGHTDVGKPCPLEHPVTADQPTPEHREVTERLTAILSDDGLLRVDELRRELMELLATVPLPGPMNVKVDGSGGLVGQLETSGDPNQPVRVLVSTLAGGSLHVSCTQMEARSWLNAAAVTQVARELVADTFQQMLAELEHQEARFRQGLLAVHPDHRPAPEQPADADQFPAGAEAHAATYQRGWEEALQAVRVGVEDCNHAGLPPADSVEPFGFRPCPLCGKRMRAYPASAGGPEWREAL